MEINEIVVNDNNITNDAERNVKLRFLRDRIEKNDTLHHKEILRIFKDNNCNISSNRNGSFINLSIIDEVTLEKINKYLEHVKHQEFELKEKIDAQEYEKLILKNDI